MKSFLVLLFCVLAFAFAQQETVASVNVVEFKELSNNVNTKFTKITNNINDVTSQVTTLKSQVLALQQNKVEVDSQIVALKAQIEQLKVQLNEQNIVKKINEFVEVASVQISTKSKRFYDIVQKNFSPFMASMKLKAAEAYVNVEPTIKKVSLAAQLYFNQGIAYANKNLPVVQALLSEKLLGLGVPSEHVDFIVLSLISLVFLTILTLSFGFVTFVLAKFLSIFCFCCKSKPAKRA